jgi:LPXTG-motif cell wall-anchored protein
MLNIVKRFSLLTLMAIFAFGFLPSVVSATTLKQDVELKILGEANVLNVVKFGGKCDKIFVKVRTKDLKDLGVDISKLKVSLKYDVFHNINKDALKGKIVGTGEVSTKQSGDFYEIVYDPTANPNGPAGNYAFKIYLSVGKKKSKTGVVVRIKINEPCKGDNNGGTNNGGTNNGGTDNGGTDNGGTNNGGTNNGGTNNGGTDNGGANAGTNNGGANAGTNNGGANAGANAGTNAGANAGTNAGANAGVKPNGGKLPKTANNFATSVALGAALSLAGVAVLAYRRRETN